MSISIRHQITLKTTKKDKLLGKDSYISTGSKGVLAHDPRIDKVKNLKKPQSILIYAKGFMLISEESLGTCDNCNGPVIHKFCRKYNGYIGKCTACNVNWRES